MNYKCIFGVAGQFDLIFCFFVSYLSNVRYVWYIIRDIYDIYLESTGWTVSSRTALPNHAFFPKRLFGVFLVLLSSLLLSSLVVFFFILFFLFCPPAWEWGLKVRQQPVTQTIEPAPPGQRANEHRDNTKLRLLSVAGLSERPGTAIRPAVDQ